MNEPQTKKCQNCGGSFVIEPEDFDFYERMQVPPPTFCWLCRAQRRLAFRNERALYKRKSDFSGKEIFSSFPPEAPFTVYENEVWYSDTWDGLTYGQEYDFSRPFLAQFFDLWKRVPMYALSVIAGTNSDYANNHTAAKNCYLIFNATYSEDCSYGNGIDYSKNCVDNSHIMKCEFCYGNFWLTRCNRTFFSSRCEDCTDVWFSRDLRGCTDCFGCVGLRNKSNHIWNKPHSKEEYTAFMSVFNPGSSREIRRYREQMLEFGAHFPVKYIEGTHNTDVSGNYVFNSKNVKNSFLVREGENLKYCQYLQVPPNKDCYDHTTWGNGNEMTYEVCQAGRGTYNLRFSLLAYPDVRNFEYCALCQSCSDLFGCVSLRNKQYCILNKQYSKEEYEALVPKIRKHMMDMPYTDAKGRVYRYGEFFPVEFSPYPYNETATQDYFPLTKTEATAAGFAWRDQPERNYAITMPTDMTPDDIATVDDSILSAVIGCAHGGTCNDNCTTAFRITPVELAFYRQMKLPLPHLCPSCRTSERLLQRGRFALYHRTCQCAGTKSENGTYTNTASHNHGEGKCGSKFETSYSPDRKEVVYCEQCYQAEVA